MKYLKNLLKNMPKSNFTDFDEYQKFCKSTAVYPKIGNELVFPMLGLSGEVGEVSEKVKKIFRDDGGVVSQDKKVEIAKELGDVLWYVTQLVTELKLNLSDVVELNLEKISKRTIENKIHGSGDNR